MPIISFFDSDKIYETNYSSSTVNNLNLLLKNTSNNTTTNNANSAILASALIQQIQQQQNLNNKFFNNNILLNCIKSNLAANLNSSLNSSLTDNPKQMNYGRYKTELCRQFSENGECKYGDKCQFAHGVADLKDVNRHPKYKTDYCKTFHSKGFCPYGPRCHFIHEFYEKNTEIIDNNKLNSKQQDKKQKSSSLSTKQQQEDINLNSQIDKQLEAIQAQLTSSLFSTITEESSSAIINETTLSAEQLEANSNKLADKLNDPLDEFNQSQLSFACSNSSFSPVIMSSSSSTSVSSATSPTLSSNKNVSIKKLQNPLANGVLFENNENIIVNDAFNNSNKNNENNAKLSKQLLEAVLLNKSINLTGSNSLSQTYDETDIYTLLNQVKLNSPQSPTPMRTRSSTSSTSSSTSSCSASSMSSSGDFFDRNQSPVKTTQNQLNSFLNMTDLQLYALAHQQNDQQLDMISFKLNNNNNNLKENSSLINKVNNNKLSSNRYLGPIGKPLTTDTSYDATSFNLQQQQQQQLFANINSLLMNQQQQQQQQQKTVNNDLLYKNNRQLNW